MEQKDLDDSNQKEYFATLIEIARRLADAEISAAEEKRLAAQKLADTERSIAKEKFDLTKGASLENAAAKSVTKNTDALSPTISEPVLTAPTIAEAAMTEPTVAEPLKTEADYAEALKLLKAVEPGDYDLQLEESLASSPSARVRQILEDVDTSTGIWPHTSLGVSEDADETVKRIIAENSLDAKNYINLRKAL